MLTPAPSPFSRYSLYTPAKHEHNVCKQNRNAVNTMGTTLRRKQWDATGTKYVENLGSYTMNIVILQIT